MPSVKSGNSKAPVDEPISYTLLNAVLGILFFVLPYKLWIENSFEGFPLLGLILLTMILGGIVGSLVARQITGYGNNKNVDAYIATQNFTYSLIYSLLVFSGIISWIFEYYPIWDTYQLDVIKILFILKLLLFVFSEWLSKKVITGGKYR